MKQPTAHINMARNMRLLLRMRGTARRTVKKKQSSDTGQASRHHSAQIISIVLYIHIVYYIAHICIYFEHILYGVRVLQASGG